MDLVGAQSNNPNPVGATSPVAPPMNPPGVNGLGAASSALPPLAAPSAPTAPVGAPAPSPQSLDRTPTRKLLDGEGNDLPDDAELYEISRSNFKKRLQRANSSQLKQAFGTDNVEEILAWKQQNEDYKKREEEAKLAQMTEADRYRTQFERSQNEASHWRQQFEQLQEQHMLREQDRQVMGLVAKHVDPDCLDFVTQQLAMHLQTLEEDEMRDPQTYITSWVGQYIKDHPKYGVGPAQPVAPAAPPAGSMQAPGLPQGVHQVQIPGQGGHGAPRQVPMHNGAGAGRPQNAVPAGQLANKTAAPGQPNSMTDDEWRSFKRAQGFTF